MVLLFLGIHFPLITNKTSDFRRTNVPFDGLHAETATWLTWNSEFPRNLRIWNWGPIHYHNVRVWWRRGRGWWHGCTSTCRRAEAWGTYHPPVTTRTWRVRVARRAVITTTCLSLSLPGNHHLLSDTPRRNCCLSKRTGLTPNKRRKRVTAWCDRKTGQNLNSLVFFCRPISFLHKWM